MKKIDKKNSLIKKILPKVLLILFVLAASSGAIFAQCDPDDPGTPGDCDEEFDPDNVPIDGGASVLIAAGVAYGLKKVHDKRKENKKADMA